MALTHRTQKLGQLITSVSKPQGDLFVKYQGFITLPTPKLRVCYQHYSSSGFPILDPFLCVLVGSWLQNLLGIPSKQPEAIVKRVNCRCKYCEKVNKFLQSGTVMEMFEVANNKKCSDNEVKVLSHPLYFSGLLQKDILDETPTQGPSHGAVQIREGSVLSISLSESEPVSEAFNDLPFNACGSFHPTGDPFIHPFLLRCAPKDVSIVKCEQGSQWPTPVC